MVFLVSSISHEEPKSPASFGCMMLNIPQFALMRSNINMFQAERGRELYLTGYPFILIYIRGNFDRVVPRLARHFTVTVSFLGPTGFSW
jgi:hypothetical protein